MFTLAKQSKSSRAWFRSFPYAHPDPTLPALIFNTQNELFKNRDVRWALALLIDIKAVSMASYRGAATISAIGVPPTGSHPETYHAPMEDWLKTFEIDTGKRKIKPYDPTVGKQIADMLRPSMGEQIPTDPKEIAKSFGMRLVEAQSAGRPGAAREGRLRASAATPGSRPTASPSPSGSWSRANLRPVMTRAGSMIVQQWRQFGIDAKIDIAQGTLPTRRAAGDFDTFIGWSVETCGGHQDLSFFLDSWHSQFVAPARQAAAAAQLAALVAARSSTRSSSRSASVGFDDPKAIELGRDYVKLVAREMPIIPLMAYNVFTVMDETYWTGYPTAENDPYADPVPNWGNSRYMFVKLKPAS